MALLACAGARWGCRKLSRCRIVAVHGRGINQGLPKKIQEFGFPDVPNSINWIQILVLGRCGLAQTNEYAYCQQLYFNTWHGSCVK